MAKIVVVGNCQAESLAGFYRRFVASWSGDEVAYVPSYEHLGDENGRILASADILVQQVLDFEPKVDLGELKPGVRRHFVPFATGSFLWPFASEPHIDNKSEPFLRDGPYAAQLGDAYLNRKIAQRVDPETAVEQYLNEDLVRLAQLDRRFELVMEKQRQRDAICGYHMADAIEACFREEPSFLSPAHPGLRIALELATQFFDAMGVGSEQLLRMQEQVVVTPFPKDELPIHPSIARHFGLRYIADPDNHRYRYLHEGRFTFREFALRYMRYDWNAQLQEAIELCCQRDYHGALPRLATALQQSPRAAGGHYYLAECLGRVGRSEEALAEFRRAAELDPAYGAGANYETAVIYAEQGRIAEGLEPARRAVALDPGDPHMCARLGMLLRQHGDLDAAEAVLRRATQLSPPNAHAFVMLGEIYAEKGRGHASVTALRRATEIEPDNSGFWHHLAHACRRLGKLGAAIAAARASVALDETSPHTHGLLGGLLREAGDLAGAEEALRRANALPAPDAVVSAMLGDVLAEQGRFDEAAAAFRRAIALDPASAAFHGALGRVLTRSGELQAGLAAARQAAALEPENPHFAAQVAELVQRTGPLHRPDDGGQRETAASADVAAAVAREPGPASAEPVSVEWHAGVQSEPARETSVLPPPTPGGTVIEHRRNAASEVADDNVGWLTVAGLTPGAEYTFACRLYIPAPFRGERVILCLGDPLNVEAPADCACREWQLVSIRARIPAGVTRLAVVLRVDSTAPTTIYSSDWDVSEATGLEAAASLSELARHEPTAVGPAVESSAGAQLSPAVPEAEWFSGQQLAPAGITQEIVPPMPGGSVLKHVRSATAAVADTNVGWWVLRQLQPGAVYRFSCRVFVPAAFAGSEVALWLGAPADRAAYADLSRRGQWQEVSIVAPVPGGVRELALVLRVASAVETMVYSSLWRIEQTGGLRPGAASDEVAAGREDAGPAALDIAAVDLMMRFESLGENCEFGLVQRRCGAEPLGLLRFATAPLPNLVRALRSRFEHFGEPDRVAVELAPNGEYMVRDRQFGLLYHAWVRAGELSPAEIHAREVRRLPFLTRKLLEDLAAAEKIFVCHAGPRGGDPATLLDALRAYGPNTLLWVELADAQHPPGTVERAAPSLLKGYIDRFAPPENAHYLSFEPWFAICREADRLRRSETGRTVPQPGTAPALEAGLDTEVIRLDPSEEGWYGGRQRAPAAVVDDLPAPVPGASVLRHVRDSSDVEPDANVGWWVVKDLRPGEVYRVSCQVYIPRMFRGDMAALCVGQPFDSWVDADFSRRDQWQPLSILVGLPPDVAELTAVLRAGSAVETAFYSACWTVEPTGPLAAEPARASRRTDPPQPNLSPADLMLRFESLGENCEFGLVQRLCGAEPLGLLRFPTAPLASVIAAVAARFEGFGAPRQIEVNVSNIGEYLVRDTKFGIAYHSWVPADRMTPEEVHAREVRRLPLLVRKLIEELEAGEKIFVFHGLQPLRTEDVLPLAADLRRYAPNNLLWVDLTDAAHPARTVEWIMPGLMKGYIERFAPAEYARDLLLDSWLAICREAYRLLQDRQAAPARGAADTLIAERRPAA